MTRSVVAVDTTVFYSSVARLIEDDPRPRCGYKFAKPVEGSHHPVVEMLKQQELAQQVVDAIVSGGVPELVVLVTQHVKPIHQSMKAVSKNTYQRETTGDTTAVRRCGVHWELVRQLHEKRIPVAEISPLTLGYVLCGKAAWGTAGYKLIADKVQTLWPDAARPDRELEDKPGTWVPDERYRMSTVGLAALGCIAAGIPVPYGEGVGGLEITDKLLEDVRRGSAFPPGFKVGDGERRAQIAEHKAERRHRDATRAAKFYAKKTDAELDAVTSLPSVELENLKPTTAEGRRELKRRMDRQEEARFVDGLESET